MKTLLRHTRTGLYFQGAGNWTNDPQNGYDFRFIDRALHYIKTWEMTEVEIAFAFDDAQSVMTLPLEKTELHYAAA